MLTLYWLFCFVLTHLPASEVPQVEIPFLDKAVHFGIYLGLGFLFTLRGKNTKFETVFTVLIAYAIFDEITQIPIYRTADLLDLLADALGIITGYGVFLVSQKRKLSK